MLASATAISNYVCALALTEQVTLLFVSCHGDGCERCYKMPPRIALFASLLVAVHHHFREFVNRAYLACLCHILVVSITYGALMDCLNKLYHD